MTDGDVYKVIELIGTSKTSWEEAVKTVVDRATKTLRDLRIAEVKELDVRLENGKIAEYRAKVRLSFKYEGDERLIQSPESRLLNRTEKTRINSVPVVRCT